MLEQANISGALIILYIYGNKYQLQVRNIALVTGFSESVINSVRHRPQFPIFALS